MKLRMSESVSQFVRRIGRLGGLKAASRMTAEARIERARKAAAARTKNRKPK